MKLALVPGLPVLGEAFLAINRPALGGLEGYFTFITAIRTSRLVHFSWAKISSAAKSFVTHLNFSCKNYILQYNIL
jgi:hypothetical protein